MAWGHLAPHGLTAPPSGATGVHRTDLHSPLRAAPVAPQEAQSWVGPGHSASFPRAAGLLTGAHAGGFWSSGGHAPHQGQA